MKAKMPAQQYLGEAGTSRCGDDQPRGASCGVGVGSATAAAAAARRQQRQQRAGGERGGVGSWSWSSGATYAMYLTYKPDAHGSSIFSS